MSKLMNKVPFLSDTSNITAKSNFMAEDVVQAVELLPNTHEALG
jgi:hypothetical protein